VETPKVQYSSAGPVRNDDAVLIPQKNLPESGFVIR
jgi:hypothetical protein